MTNKEMNKLADIIISKLEIKQTEWDQEFHENIINNLENQNNSNSFITLSEEEMLIGELARLQTILMIFEDNDTVEGYNKAAIVLNKLNAIKNKLRKGTYD